MTLPHMTLPLRTPVLFAAAVVSLTLAVPSASRATEGPWCAVTNRGVIVEDCSMRSFEMCRQLVIAGNRGFCNPNPRWFGDGPRARRRGY
jgi:Protein of unknown function (DUF3551)